MFSWQSGCPECLIQKISCVFTRVIRSLVDFLQVRNQPDQYPAAIYLSKASSGNTRKLCEICSKQTMKTRIDVNFFSLFLSLLTSNRFIDFTHCFGVSIVDFGEVNAGWVVTVITCKRFCDKLSGIADCGNSFDTRTPSILDGFLLWNQYQYVIT